MTSDVITLKGMQFQARVGVLPREAEIAQLIEMDVSLSYERPADDIVDYRLVYAAAQAALGSDHTRYLEDIAESTASAVLRIPNVRATTVAVRKPHVSLGGPLDYAEVRIERSNHG